MDPLDLLGSLGRRPAPPIDPATHSPCPTCGATTKRTMTGQPSLCLPCTEAEVGEPLEELIARVSRKMTRRAYLALPRDDDGAPILPSLTNRQWYRLHGKA